MIFSLRLAWRRVGGDARAYTCSLVVLALVCGSMTAGAQSVSLTNGASESPSGPAVSGEVEASPAVVNVRPEAPAQHRFLDTENRLLFAGAAALSAADFAATRANLRAGGRELNPVTRLFGSSTAGLAVNFAGETAVVVGFSYYFHRTQHHKLERLTSILNIGTSAFAVGYDLNQR